MPVIFTNEEYGDIHFIYGFCNGNAREAVKEYKKRFPNRKCPSYQVFINTHIKFRECGFGKNKDVIMKTKTKNYRRMNKKILMTFDADNSLSTRRAAQLLQLPRARILRVLHQDHRHAYHLQPVQHLLQSDFEKRLNFCKWLLNKYEENSEFVQKILWTDEARFSRKGIFNRRNLHIWAHENPHGKRPHRFQQEFSVNVWLGIIGKYVCGPFILPERLNSTNFVNFLEENLFTLLEDVPLDVRNNSWFQMDGAPAHFGQLVSNWLKNKYDRRLIKRLTNSEERDNSEGPISWPPRSPDLNPLDYYIWGHLKNEVYSVEITSKNHLIERLMNACSNLKQRENEILRGVKSIINRCEKCVEVGGGHFEQFL